MKDEACTEADDADARPCLLGVDVLEQRAFELASLAKRAAPLTAKALCEAADELTRSARVLEAHAKEICDDE